MPIHGTIHGGVLCDIADAAIGTPRDHLDEDESFTSIDLQINFFRPVWNGRIRAVAKPVNVGVRLVATSATSLGMMQAGRASYEYSDDAQRRSGVGEITRWWFCPSVTGFDW